MTKQMLELIVDPHVVYPLLQEKEKSKKDKIIILDISSGENYNKGTIPGAINFPYDALVIGEPPYAHKLPLVEKFAAALKKIGYKQSSHIIAYDDEFGLKSARLYWTMRMAGLDGFSYLNGGTNAWVEAGYDLIEGINLADPMSSRLGAIKWNNKYLKSLKQIKSALPDKKFFIWDARSYQEWTGTEGFENVGGRIPGAQHLEWNEFLDEKGRIMEKDKVQKKLEMFLGDNKKPVVAYCKAHRRSAFAFFIAAYCGKSISAYDGSWGEWEKEAADTIEKD